MLRGQGRHTSCWGVRVGTSGFRGHLGRAKVPGQNFQRRLAEDIFSPRILYKKYHAGNRQQSSIGLLVQYFIYRERRT